MVDSLSVGYAASEPVPVASMRERDRLAPLPTPLTAFVGREREVAAVLALLRRPVVRLVTLIGPGGVGKTRLAVRVAEELRPEIAAGVAFVELDPVRDPDRVLPAIARAVGVREEGDRPLVGRLAAALRELDLLLVLDNIEQVVAAGPQVGSLLELCPRLKALATGRAAWRLSGEHEFPVPPLELPNPGRLPTPDELAATEAGALFLKRARAVRPDFVLTEANAAAVAEICRRLDGLPLAIELAAARSKVLSPQALLDRLRQRLPLLGGGPRDQPARLRTMRDAVDWSYGLLTEPEQALFRRLTVFVGGFDLEAAEDVSREIRVERRETENPSLDARLSTLDSVASLVDKSLLRREEHGGGDVRFGMLETIREYGLDRLAAGGEDAATRDAHLDHFLALAERAEPELTGPDQIAWLDRLEAEHHNLRAALDRALEAGRLEQGLRLAGALLRYWEHHSHYAEERRWLEEALARDHGVSPGLRAKALHAAGVLAFLQGDHVRATHALEEAVVQYRRAGDDYGTAFALNRLGTLALHAGDHERAATRFGEAERLIRAVGDVDGIAALLGQLGYAALVRGDHDEATARLEESLAHYRSLGSKMGSGRVLIHLGRTLTERGEAARALPLLREALGMTREVGNRWYLAEGLEATATAVARAGDGVRSARLWGAAETLRLAIGAPVPPADRARYREDLAALEGRLGAEGFAAARAAGRALTPDEAIAEAAAVESAPPAEAGSDAAEAAQAVGLTPREIEILRLLAEGRTNPEIADILFISPRTASTHVGNILGKLGVSSRAAAVAYAHRQGLV